MKQSKTRHSLDEDYRRRKSVIDLFSMVGLSITLILGLSALFSQNFVLGAVLLSAATVFGLSTLLLIKNQNKRFSKIAPVILVLCLMSLMLYLVIDGGVANTGPLWIYIVPPVAMFIAGFVYGVLTVILFMITCAIVLFYPNEVLLTTSYTIDFKLRLLFSFATVTFLSAFYEYSRQTSYTVVKELSEKFEELASNDALTHLPNRRGIHQFIDFAFAQATRKKHPVSILLCDIDRFKTFNDQLGHDGGDIVLVHVAELFTSSIRRQDAVSRWGGEEFLFVLPETDEGSAFVLAEKIRQCLESSSVSIGQQQLQVTASFGVAQLSSDLDLNLALSRADKALYFGKENGRNQTVSASSLASR